MSKTTTPSKRLRRKGASLRDDFRTLARASILIAAEEVLASDGLEEARIEEIAKRARVAVGTIYNLVGDKQALVAEIVGARQRELLQLLSSALEQREPFRKQLHSFVRELFAYCQAHGRFFRVVIEADRKKSYMRGTAGRARAHTLDEIRALYRTLVERGVAEGELDERDRELYPVVLMGMLREVVFSELEASAAGPRPERVEQVVRVFLEGAGKR
jgi:TetR/AcrR family transcriptional regulator